MAWVEKDHSDHLVPTPCCVQVANQQPRLPRATSSLALNACRDGASTASLGNLFQCEQSYHCACPSWMGNPLELSQNRGARMHWCSWDFCHICSFLWMFHILYICKGVKA